jgi:hypothetical protein
MTDDRDVELRVGSQTYAVHMDFSDRRWSMGEASNRPLEEGDFPLIVFVDAKRYEFYSDGTFAQEELNADELAEGESHG